MMQEKQYLYRLTFPNGMVYIGATSDIESRWANNGSHYKGQYVWGAIQEFGWDNIKREVLLHLPESYENDEHIRTLEKDFIRAYGDMCYNLKSTKKHHLEQTLKGREKGCYAPKVLWTIDGVSKPAKDWCVEKGVSYGRVVHIVQKYGLTPEQAVQLPAVPRNMSLRAIEYWRRCGYDFFGETETQSRA